MRDTYWLPLCKAVLGHSAVSLEPRDVMDESGHHDKRPKDISWGFIPAHKFQGMDIGYANPFAKTDPNSRSLPLSARKTGHAAKHMEQTKFNNLSKFHIQKAHRPRR